MRLVVMLLLALVTAGCASQAGPAEEPLDDAAATPAPTTAREPEGAEPTAASTDRRVVVLEATATATLAIGAPCTGALRPCSRGPVGPGVLDVDEAGASEGLLTVWWNASTPAGTRARIDVHAGDEHVAEAEGESPLALKLPDAVASRRGEVTVVFQPAVGSVAAQQEAHLVLALTYLPTG